MEKLDKRLSNKSREIVKALRHTPELYNFILDKDGYVSVDSVLKEFNITLSDLDSIVFLNDKKRLQYGTDSRIRAAQGHSVDINIDDTLTLIDKHQEQYEYFYHGTSVSNLENIIDKGILKMGRNHAHLSKDLDTAKKVAFRWATKNGEDKVLIFKIKAKKLCHNENVYESSNGVILTRHVPPSTIHSFEEVDLVEKELSWYDKNKLNKYAENISNRIMTPDGTILQSTSVHDFVEYTDKNGEWYMVDGGLEYFKGSVNKEKAYDLSITDSAEHVVIRHHIKWGNRGKDGKSPLEFKKLAHMSDNHILNVLLNVPTIRPIFKLYFIKELEYRHINKISIKDED